MGNVYTLQFTSLCVLCEHSVEADTSSLSFTGQVQRRNWDSLNWSYNFNDNPSSSQDFWERKKKKNNKPQPADLLGFGR